MTYSAVPGVEVPMPTFPPEYEMLEPVVVHWVTLELDANAQSNPVGEVEEASKNIPLVPVASDASVLLDVQYGRVLTVMVPLGVVLVATPQDGSVGAQDGLSVAPG